jgi:hypothetical protein
MYSSLLLILKLVRKWSRESTSVFLSGESNESNLMLKSAHLNVGDMFKYLQYMGFDSSSNRSFSATLNTDDDDGKTRRRLIFFLILSNNRMIEMIPINDVILFLNLRCCIFDCLCVTNFFRPHFRFSNSMFSIFSIKEERERWNEEKLSNQINSFPRLLTPHLAQASN